VQDSKEFGWDINGDINYNWKKLLENKVRNWHNLG
jgi:glutathione reductase (NADPH)